MTTAYMSGEIGPWRLGVKLGRIPCHPSAKLYFVHAASAALDRLHELGFALRDIAGDVVLEAVDHRSKAAGYYESETDELVVTARHEPRTDYGGDLGARYGQDPGRGMIAWAICHENAHRIWYRRLSPGGREVWTRFHQAMVDGFTKEVCLGMARRLGAGPELAIAEGASHAEVLGGAARLTPEEKVLAPVLFGVYGGKLEGFCRWLLQGAFEKALASAYAEKKAKESWSEAIASVAMEDGDPKPAQQSEAARKIIRAVGKACLRVGNPAQR